MAQAVLKFQNGGRSLGVDGVAGNETKRAFHSASAETKDLITKSALAATGLDISSLIPAIVLPNTDFVSDVVPVVARAALSAGLLPLAVVTQITLESGWGQSALARDHFNFGGLKFNSVSSFPGIKPLSTTMKTQEFIDGKNVEVSAGFASFRSVEHFADVYVWYLLKSGSAYRYPGLSQATTVRDYFAILKKGGYATDPNYVSKAENLSRSVKDRTQLFA